MSTDTTSPSPGVPGALRPVTRRPVAVAVARVTLCLVALAATAGCEADGTSPVRPPGDADVHEQPGHDTTPQRDASPGAETQDRDHAGDVVEEPPRRGGGVAPQGFWLEPWPVGDRWYLYDGRTHTLTPRPQVYLVTSDQGALLFRVLGYYGARGESGVFSLRVRTWSGSAWGAQRDLQLSANVKERAVCLSVQAHEVSCDDQAATLVFRSDRRVLPAAGFVVANPAIYEAGHPLGRRVRLLVLDEDVWRTPPALDAFPEQDRPSVARSVNDWLIGYRWATPEGRVWLQATTSFQLAQWQALPEANDALRLRARCVPLGTSAAVQVPLADAALREEVVQAPTTGRTAWYRLCPEIVRVDEVPGYLHGTWPDSATFDLIIEGHPEGLALRPAPGSLLMDWTGDEAQRAAEIGDVVLPESLWE